MNIRLTAVEKAMVAKSNRKRLGQGKMDRINRIVRISSFIAEIVYKLRLSCLESIGLIGSSFRVGSGFY